MRTIAPVFVVLLIGVSGAMLGASGFEAAWGGDPPRTDAAQEEVNKSSGQVGPGQEPISGPVSSADSSIVGLISSGLSSVVDIAGAVIVLPLTLVELGFPAWFAYPIGGLAETVVGIGIIEFATNREWT